MWPKDMSKAQLKELQRELNEFSNTYVKSMNPLIVDGENGNLTRRRIRWAKYFLGYAGKAGKNSTVIDDDFRWFLNHPKGISRRTRWQIRRVPRGIRRRQDENRRWRRNKRKAHDGFGVASWESRPVAEAALPYLHFARKNGWKGGLNSGWRDPDYSRSLCMRMCGAPSCPGRCAGLASNHVGSTPDKFAVDVSDYANFGRIMKNYPGRKIFNALGAQDPVHFSPSGR